ncbi:helix-turn-helix domain-containing protein [Nonomuraea angiospora]|uniref:helix-turn-helix domain-containing protein n=1 Tax=Nonomuraea angiospora TaxID=46172 RepID=UPI0029B258A4|nr:helix-turn-helix domain-containing protein [Nonomuraea angiospora]MDX3101500.1 helix-turn-helix domain-containing protein [Nonomuraea angiospora]
MIAARVGCHPATVRRRLRRFSAEGIHGLAGLPGPGRKPRITQAERSQIIAPAKARHRGIRAGRTGVNCGPPRRAGRRCGHWTRSPPRPAPRGFIERPLLPVPPLYAVRPDDHAGLRDLITDLLDR